MPGRPRSNPELVRNAPPLRIRLNAAERKTLDDAAAVAMKGRTTPGTGVTATWAREVLAREARKLLKTSRK